ncbi:MAG TPA: hypothetical protein VKY85_09225 [Candidatus Angelobacter sp.]|nr:hypothetical protein [Candidatus Angelobacter sp.]
MSKTRPQKVNPKQIEAFQKSAARKLVAARKTLQIDEEASYEIAYEAMIKASLAFILAHGQRVRSQIGHHMAIIEFCELHLGPKHSSLLQILDRMRRKRNQMFYDVGSITQLEAKNAVDAAREYLALIEEEIRRKLQPPPAVGP